MAIKSTNSRITITLTKKQVHWLNTQAKRKHLTLSQFVSWLVSAKANEIKDFLELNAEDYNDIIRIAQTRWLD